MLLSPELGHDVTAPLEAKLVLTNGAWTVFAQQALYGDVKAPLYRLCWSPIYISVCLFRAPIAADVAAAAVHVMGSAPAPACAAEFARRLAAVGFSWVNREWYRPSRSLLTPQEIACLSAPKTSETGLKASGTSCPTAQHLHPDRQRRRGRRQ